MCSNVGSVLKLSKRFYLFKHLEQGLSASFSTQPCLQGKARSLNIRDLLYFCISGKLKINFLLKWVTSISHFVGFENSLYPLTTFLFGSKIVY